MILYEKTWRNKEPREHSIFTAISSAVTPDPYSYDNAGQRADQTVDKLIEMFARLVEELHTDGQLTNAQVVKIVGRGFFETKAQAE
ncbi:hypothetical protein CcrColossus_gp400 [Caulobacter phage CcrColossus]|uniref:Uncharacterized protein n=1 Tax=Caulobacter phage CcrColossus TaxID=1211640 RepID=K4JV78_9CAUD|nr:hypothetical protein CcrColossus_gp400 [Caulobacter phage CcrColossus]AFU88270.1 hypothetical protein CcrColossus_gp400 [Caulobacter phage CcrColossus]